MIHSHFHSSTKRKPFLNLCLTRPHPPKKIYLKLVTPVLISVHPFKKYHLKFCLTHPPFQPFTQIETIWHFPADLLNPEESFDTCLIYPHYNPSLPIQPRRNQFTLYFWPTHPRTIIRHLPDPSMLRPIHPRRNHLTLAWPINPGKVQWRPREVPWHPRNVPRHLLNPSTYPPMHPERNCFTVVCSITTRKIIRHLPDNSTLQSSDSKRKSVYRFLLTWPIHIEIHPLKKEISLHFPPDLTHPFATHSPEESYHTSFLAYPPRMIIWHLPNPSTFPPI